MQPLSRFRTFYTVTCLLLALGLYLKPHLQLALTNYQAKSLFPSLIILQDALSHYEQKTGHLPKADNWQTEIREYLPNQDLAPTKHWAMNDWLNLSRGVTYSDGTEPNKAALKSSDLPKRAILLTVSDTESSFHPFRTGELTTPFQTYQTKLGSVLYWKGTHSLYLTNEGPKLLTPVDARSQLQLQSNRRTQTDELKTASITPQENRKGNKIPTLSDEQTIKKHNDYYELNTSTCILSHRELSPDNDQSIIFSIHSQQQTKITITIHFQNQFKQTINYTDDGFQTSLSAILTPNAPLQTQLPIPQNINHIGFNPGFGFAENATPITRKQANQIFIPTNPFTAPNSFAKDTKIIETKSSSIIQTNDIQPNEWSQITIPIPLNLIPPQAKYLTAILNTNNVIPTHITEPTSNIRN